MIARYSLAGLLATVVTFGLFYLMQALISVASSQADQIFVGQVIEFVRLKREPELELKKRRVPDKKPPQEEPPPPEFDLARAERPDQAFDAMAIAAYEVDIGVGLDLGLIASDQDIVPIVRVNPQYPIRAAEREIEGWVEVEFTISAAGTVKDPIVVGSNPSTIFNSAALRAIRKWKYSPKIEGGVAVERPSVRVRINFDLGKDR